MLNDVKPWTEQWKEEGLQEGLQKGLQRGRQEGMQKGMQEGRQEERQEVVGRMRGLLLGKLKERFGPLPAEARGRVEALGAIEDLMELTSRIGTAPSLAALGLLDESAEER